MVCLDGQITIVGPFCLFSRRAVGYVHIESNLNDEKHFVPLFATCLNPLAPLATKLGKRTPKWTIGCSQIILEKQDC